MRSDKVKQFGTWEWLEIAGIRVGARRAAAWCNRKGNSAFGLSVIKLAERTRVDALWGYDGVSLEVFRWAKRRGIYCVLDQTIGHAAAQNEVLSRERDIHPEFFFPGFTLFDARWLERQNEELALADTVVVGSAFCADTLVNHGCDRDKIRIVPYGFDETLFPTVAPAREVGPNKPVNFLFVGQVTPRKGVAYLLDAFASLDPAVARLTMVGALQIPPTTLKKYSQRVIHLPSLPRHEVVRYFVAADCFVFPSLFEGGGIVLYEAGGAGLGIVQSDRCGDGVRSLDAGIVMDEISVEGVANAVGNLAADPEYLMSMHRAAWRDRQDRSWSVYRANVRRLIAASVTGELSSESRV